MRSDVELLTAEEEAQLGRRVRAWRDEGIDPEGGLSARNELVTRNFNLIRFVLANTGLTRGRRFEDFIPAGEDGLIRAANNFDPARGFRFSTYATRWIYQAAQRWHRQDQVISIPHHIYSSAKRQSPKFRDHVERARRITLCGGEDGDAIAMLARPERDASSACELVALLFERASLTGSEIEVIRRRFGMGREAQTLKDIGRDMGCTREWIRQIEARALGKIRASSRIRPDLRAAVRDYHEAV